MLPTAPNPEGTAFPDIWMAGFLHAAHGLDETGCLITHRPERAGIPFQTRSWQNDFMTAVPPVTGPGPGPGKSAAGPATGQPGLSLLGMNGGSLPGFVEGGGGTKITRLPTFPRNPDIT